MKKILILLFLLLFCGPVMADEAIPKDGIFRSYYSNKKARLVISYKDGQRHGVAKAYDPRGRLTQKCYYKQGKLEGLCKSFFYTEDGFDQDGWTEESYKDGVRIGNTKGYYKNGRLYSDWNNDPHFSGINKIYYENGKISKESNFSDGKLQGISREYYRDGKMKAEWNYKDDKLDGISKYYDQDSELITEQIYKDGQLMNTKHSVNQEDSQGDAK